MLYVGIDPGERWCGLAVLLVTQNRTAAYAEARTLDVEAHGGYLHTARRIATMLPSRVKTHVALEQFSVRPHGYNRFTQGHTLRLIGALEYAFMFRTLAAETIAFVPPSSPEDAKKLFGPFFSRFRETWSESPISEHAQSAWRVLGRYMMGHHLADLKLLRQSNYARRTSHNLIQSNATDESDFVSPTMVWRDAS